MKLLKEETKVIRGFLVAQRSDELKSSELFRVCYKLNKEYTKEEVRETLKVQLEGYKDITSTIKRRVSSINSLACAFKEFKVILKFDLLYMYNIKNIVALLKRVHEHHIKEIVSELKSIYTKDIKEVDYNEAIKDKLNVLMKTFGFIQEPTEVNDKAITTFVKDKVSLMSIEQIETLIASLKTKKEELLKEDQ